MSDSVVEPEVDEVEKIEYAPFHPEQVMMWLTIIEKCALHGTSFSAIAGEATLELSAINADVAAFVAKRKQIQAEADAKAKAADAQAAIDEQNATANKLPPISPVSDKATTDPIERKA